jgi:hypothetical protein
MSHTPNHLVGSSTSSRLIEGEVDGDTVPRLAVTAGGTIELGSGSAARDVSLYRGAADVLRTDDTFQIGTAGALTLGAAGDVNLYRVDSGTLGTDDALNVGGNLQVFGNAIIAGQSGGVPGPSGQGLAAWAFDPAHIQGGTAMSASGTAQVIRLQANSAVATNIEIEVTTGGSGLSTCYALLTNDAGVQIGSGAITTDQAVPWATTGLKQMALVAPQAITPGAFYKVVLWAVGTVPQLARGAAGRPATVINSGAAQPRFATANTGLSVAPDPVGSFELTAQTAIGTAFWAAIS